MPERSPGSSPFSFFFSFSFFLFFFIYWIKPRREMYLLRFSMFLTVPPPPRTAAAPVSTRRLLPVTVRKQPWSRCAPARSLIDNPRNVASWIIRFNPRRRRKPSSQLLYSLMEAARLIAAVRTTAEREKERKKDSFPIPGRWIARCFLPFTAFRKGLNARDHLRFKITRIERTVVAPPSDHFDFQLFRTFPRVSKNYSSVFRRSTR